MGWIIWDGTKRKPAGTKIVEVRLRSGAEGRLPACGLEWSVSNSANDPNDIVYYRVVKA